MKKSFPTMQPIDARNLRRAIKYRPDIDGLRAVAVVSVVACHAGLPWARGGLIGVDIFFVISGYLIGSLVYKEIRGHSFSLGNFYARRAKRILPALFGILVFCYVAAPLFLLPTEMKAFSLSALSALVSSSNFYFWQSMNYFSPDSRLQPLLMTWSLGIEEQFYLLFPMSMLLIRKLPWRTQFLCIGGMAALSLSTSIWGTFNHPAFSFYLLPTRAWELATGVLLAIAEANHSTAKRALAPFAAHGFGVLGLGLFGLALLLLYRGISFPGYAVLLPVSGAALIIAGSHGIVNRALSWRPIVSVGLVSYSWYLWHWPLLSFARVVSNSAISQTAGVSIALLSLLCALFSYKFIELPFRTSTTPAPIVLRRYGAVLPLIILPAAVFYMTNGLPQRIHNLQAVAMGDHELIDQDPCFVETGPWLPPLRAPCIPDRKGPSIALIGDSHAAALAGALLHQRAIWQQVGRVNHGRVSAT